MATLSDVMAYLCVKYPHKDELSKARLTKMIYLADWRSALQERQQITNLVWTFNHYGPYLDDIKRTAEKEPKRFFITSTTNMYGAAKELIGVRGHDQSFNSLRPQEIRALEHVIHKTKDLTWAPFIDLVYSTYPIATQPRHTELNLVALGDKYHRELAVLSK